MLQSLHDCFYFATDPAHRSSQPTAHHSDTIPLQERFVACATDLARVPLSYLLNGGIFLTVALFCECIRDLLPRTFR